MNTFAAALTLMIALAGFVTAEERPATERIWDGESCMDDLKFFEYEILLEDARKAPTWAPDKGEKLPLSAQRAIGIARRHLERNVKTLENYCFNDLRLEHLDAENGKEYWGWIITFSNLTPRTGTGLNAPAEITVLMNGYCPPYKNTLEQKKPNKAQK